MPSYPNVFAPLELGGLTLRNRIAVTAHVTNFGDHRHLATERLAAYHVERARGGVGLIVSESLAVHPTAGPSTHYLQIWDDDSIAPLRHVTTAVEALDVPMFAQLNHGGREHRSLLTQRPLLAPSPLPSPKRPEIPHVMSHAEIEEITDAFASAAGRAARAGFRGVEIHAGHGYLLNQFLSPWANVRDDEYGGSFEDRLRFPLEVIDAVHREVGADLIVGVRISADEFTPGGLDLDDMARVARALADSGQVDYISASQGNYNSPETFIPDDSFGRTPFLDLAAGIKAAVDTVPVMGVGGVVTVADAERMRTEAGVDLVGMTRAHIADPHLIAKTLAGREDEVRRCIMCNQGCLSRLFSLADISCLQNPTVGYEEVWPVDIPAADMARRIVVVGGGPAGMEAAWVAAARGHDVTLIERDEELGGALRWLLRAGSRPEFANVVDFRTRMLERHGVDVRLGEEATVASILDRDPDVVVVATGATRERDGSYDGPVHGIEDVLGDPTRCTGRVVLHDRSHDHRVLVAADVLAERARELTVAAGSPTLASGVVGTTAAPWTRRLVDRGVRVLTGVTLESWRDDRASFRGNVNGDVTQVAVDDLVVVGDQRADDGLYRALSGQVEVHVVGDAASPREALEAVMDGHRLARDL